MPVILSSTDRPKRVTRSSASDEPSGKQRAESADRPDKRDGKPTRMGKEAETSPAAMVRTTPARAGLGWFLHVGQHRSQCILDPARMRPLVQVQPGPRNGL
jgi:hypothetical protein